MLYFYFQWHLGFFAEEYIPVRRGFDTNFGYYMGKEDYFDHTTLEVCNFYFAVCNFGTCSHVTKNVNTLYDNIANIYAYKPYYEWIQFN